MLFYERGLFIKKNEIPWSHVVARYVNSSHLNNPSSPLIPEEHSDIASIPIISGANGLAVTHQHGRLRKRGFGSCGPPGFYGTIDVHMDFERDISAFAKRGDIIVADRGINLVVQKGLHLSRSTIRRFDHNDLKSLEDVLLSVEKERRKRRGPVTRRFIVTEGVSEKDGAMVDLPKVVSLGRTGRSFTERHNVGMRLLCFALSNDLGSVANGLNSSGGFCAGSHIVVDHQHIKSTSFVFSAAAPALLAVSASEDINILQNTPLILSTLQGNVHAIRAFLDRVEASSILSHAASPIIHIHLRSAATLSASTPAPVKPPNPATPALRDAPSFDIAGEEYLLHDIRDETLAHDVWITRTRRLRGQELVEARPSTRLTVTAALSRKVCERVVGVVLTKRK
ncbi:serine palmitoyltransferase [Lactarius indigo]|nr:serine palmitoyltransferase [Lactarius indigo]